MMSIKEIEEFEKRKISDKPTFVYFIGQDRESTYLDQIVKGLLAEDYSIQFDVNIVRIELYQGDVYRQREANDLLRKYGKKHPHIVTFEKEGKIVKSVQLKELKKPYDESIKSLIKELML